MHSWVAALVLATALSRGDQAFAAGNFTAALADYRQSLSQDGKSFAAYFGAGQAALYANDIRSAAEYLNGAQVLADAKQAGLVKLLLAELRSRVRAQQTHVLSQTVTVPMTVVDPLPLISVQVDGRQAYFMLDTGAPNLVIDPDFAKELGLKLQGGFNVASRAALRRVLNKP